MVEICISWNQHRGHPLWPDSDHWTHVPGVYSSKAAMKTAHLTLWGPYWEDSRGLHSKVSGISWILLSDINGHISSNNSYVNRSPTDGILQLNYPHPHPHPTQRHNNFLPYTYMWRNIKCYFTYLIPVSWLVTSGGGDSSVFLWSALCPSVCMSFDRSIFQVICW